jgi:hypothetical protein
MNRAHQVRHRQRTTALTDAAILHRYLRQTRRLIIEAAGREDLERARDLAKVNRLIRHRLFQLSRSPIGKPEALPKGPK